MSPLPGWLSRVLGMPGAASFAQYQAIIDAAHGHEASARALADEQLAAEARGLSLGQLPEKDPQNWGRFLALASEASARTLALRPFDEQLLGVCAVAGSHAVEMDTGEGKTLVGALAAAALARAGRTAHLLSVNDYLAERDAEWMSPLLSMLSVTVGWVGQHTPQEQRRAVYAKDVVYAPVSEVGYDVLRDRFVERPADRVNPVLDAAIVDEADAVLIDEAVSPLVLAGASTESADDLARATELVRGLDPDRDFVLDEDRATATLSDAGLDRLEGQLGGINLFDNEHTPLLTQLNIALHARALVHRDVDYLVQDGAIRLINTARGRIAHLQRWPDGLHAAIEAKEGLAASTAGVILDSVTIQDLLLSYRSRAGMSGTVLAVADELTEFYTLNSGRVPRHIPSIREDLSPQLFPTIREKNSAIVEEVIRRHSGGQPVLVGTQSVAESEQFAELFAARGIHPRVLNARNDAAEASVISRAGELGAVTISTQMSGRGTDIRLGGADPDEGEKVRAVGGLAVIATGRYPSQRLDAQLRGRAGRQGDPGASVVFASVEDELMQTYAPPHLQTIARRSPSTSGAKAVSAAQSIAEGISRDRHRGTWEYYRAIAAQRTAVLRRREETLSDAAALASLRSRAEEQAGRPGARERVAEPEPTGLFEHADAGDRVRAQERAELPGSAEIMEQLDALERALGADALADLVRTIALYVLDLHWQDHLADLAELRDGIHLRALAGQNPTQEFHRLALRHFDGFFEDCDEETIALIMRLDPAAAGAGHEDLGLRRPSSTWTYMVRDNPLGTGMDRAVRAAGRTFRTTVLGL